MGLPGGALKYGESFAEAALRECKEETGYTVNLGSYIGMYDKYFASYPNGDAQTIVVAYEATIMSGEKNIDNKETFGLRWFAAKDTPGLFNQQHQDIYNDARAMSRVS